VPYVYLLVREDLPFAQQVVQSCHAAIEAARCLFPLDCPHPYLIVCAVSDEPSLWRQLHRCHRLGVRLRPFFEPDRANELTAFATEPVTGVTRRQFRNLRLLTPEPPAPPPKGGSA
jgi:hypothetical protein